MRLRFLPLVLLLLPVTGFGTTVPIPETAKSYSSANTQVEVYHDDFPDHVDLIVRAKRTVYFHIFLTSCNNCSDGLDQSNISIGVGEVVRVGSIRQLDSNRPWSHRLYYESWYSGVGCDPDLKEWGDRRRSLVIQRVVSEGEVSITADNQMLRPNNTALFIEDRAGVVTGPTGRSKFTLPDGTTFTLEPNTELVLNGFTYNPTTSLQKLTAEVVKGNGRVVVGSSGKNLDLKLKTPVGVAEIRSSNFETFAKEDGSGYLKVLKGSIVLPVPDRNGKQATTISAGKSGQTVEFKDHKIVSALLAPVSTPAPQLSAGVPPPGFGKLPAAAAPGGDGDDRQAKVDRVAPVAAGSSDKPEDIWVLSEEGRSQIHTAFKTGYEPLKKAGKGGMWLIRFDSAEAIRSGKNSLSYWIPANENVTRLLDAGVLTLTHQLKEALGIREAFGPKDAMTISFIPEDSPMDAIIGEAAPQLESSEYGVTEPGVKTVLEVLPGGGTQVVFLKFNKKYIYKILMPRE